MRPIERVYNLEKLVLILKTRIEALEDNNMNLKERVAALEGLISPKKVDYGMIYDTLREIELLTHPRSPDVTKEQWEAMFIEGHGTREQFIAERKKIKEG